MLKFVKTLGIRNDQETVIRWSSQVKPSLGGLSFYIIFLLSITLHPFVFFYKGTLIDSRFTGIIGATSLGFLMGLADDAYNTRPILKFITQLLCGLMLIYTGTYVNVFEVDLLNYAITLIWVVGLMNSINMLDNMDGITSSVSLVVALTILLVMFNHHKINNIETTVTIGLIASLIGFLKFNWSPAKMYMGDTGSQYLGILLAALSINYLWNPAPNEEVIVSRQLLIPLLSFIIPIVDTSTVVIKRISNGKSPFIGGRDHTTHHLSYMGLSERGVALVIVALSIISSLLVVYAIIDINRWTHVYTAIFLGYFIVIFSVLFIIAKRNVDKY